MEIRSENMMTVQSLRWIIRGGMILWIFVTVASLVWDDNQARENSVELAKVDARSTYNKDLVYRRWISMKGGVYVKPTESTPPNPYLSHLPKRDVITESGDPLTLMNPAYITRQVHELGFEQYGYQGHITSLNCLRPENKPDDWEAESLKKFQQGTKEVMEITTLKGEPYLRFMTAMKVEKGCLKCHGIQGYKVGDLRGGISVSVPLAPYISIVERIRHQSIAIHGVIGLLGLFAIWFTGRIVLRSHAALQEQQTRLRLALQGADLGAWDWNLQTGEMYVNRRWLEMLGLTPESTLESFEDWKRLIHPDDVARIEDFFNEHLKHEPQSKEIEYRLKHADGSWIWVLAKGRIIEHDANGKPLRASGTHLDVSQRRDDELRHRHLEEKLHQAQKMESVGRLAGGVAHDFNNLLTTIKGNTSLAMMDVAENEETLELLEEVDEATKQASNLTRQLLAFSRKQVIQPKLVDVNELIERVRRMLARLIGEDIDMKLDLYEGLGSIKVDPGQMEQILLNLAVNARDAMPGGGTLFIETQAVRLDDQGCEGHLLMSAGCYAMIAVSDTGMGMEEETQKSIFEPFFTTKEEGKGTGLGLSTVYGIIKQHKGSIQVYSESGKGTTFKMYFPLVEEANHSGIVAVEMPLSEMPEGKETILLVEDESGVRNVTEKILKGLGYRVLCAVNGSVALAMLETLDEPIDLLLTDIIMPQMNGRELAERFIKVFPKAKVVYSSGYTENVIAYHNTLDADIHFLGKPYTPQALAIEIRKALDCPGPAVILT